MADAFQPKFVDLVRNSTATTGTGNFVLGAAPSGFTSFADAVEAGERFYYSAIGVDKPAEREVGRGTMQADGTIRREPIDGTTTNFTSGKKNVSLIAAAEWFTKVSAEGSGGEALAEDYGAAGDGVTDDAAAINAALAASDVRLATGKIYAVAAPVLIPSNRTLRLNGATIKLLPGFVTPSIDGFGVGAAVASINSSNVRIFGPGTIDSNKIGLGGALGERKHGVMMGNAVGFLCEGFTVQNCTGYACFSQGQGTAEQKSSGVWRFIDTYNSEYHNEQMQAKNVSVLDCRFFDGDGDIACGGWLHPFFNGFGCDDIHFARCVGKGAVSNAVAITASATHGHRNITISDCRFDQTSPGNCLAAEGAGGVDGLRIVNSEFNAPTGVGASIEYVTNLAASNSRFHGSQNIIILNRVKGTISDCRLVGTPGSGISANGIGTAVGDTVTDVAVRGGSIEIDGNAGAYFQSSGRIRIGPDTLFLYNGVQDGPSSAVDGEVSVGSGTIRWYHQNRQLHCVPFGSAAFKLPDLPWRIGTRLRFVNPTSSTSATVAADSGATYNGPATVPHYGFVEATLIAPSTWAGIGGRLSGAELNTTASRLLGRGTSSNGPAQEITIGAGLAMSGTTLSATGVGDGDKGDVVVSGTGATWTVESAAAGFTAGGGVVARGAIPSFSGVGAIAYVAGGNATFGAWNGTGAYWEPAKLIGSTVVLAAAGNQTRLEAHSTGVTVTGVLSASGNISAANMASAGAVTSSGAGGIGYASGAGGAVSQATSKSTGVTLNKASGRVTMNSASLAAGAVVAFTVTNSEVAATDTVNLNLQSGNATAGSYRYWIDKVSAGSFVVAVENRTSGALSEALVLNFAVVKAVSA